MKILQVSPTFSPHIGGLERVVDRVSKELVKLGHKVVVCTANLPRGKDFEVVNGVVVHRLPVYFSIFQIPFSFFFNRICKENTDVIHVHIPPITGTLSSIFVGKLRRKPVFLTYHNDTVGERLITRIVAKFYNIFQDRFILKNVTKITVATKDYKKLLISRGIDEARIEVVPYSVDTYHSNIDPKTIKEKYSLRNKRVVLFVGVLEKRKGVEYLVKAVSKMVEKMKDIRVVIVGEGSQRDRLEFLSRQLKVDGYIVFTGRVSESVKNALLDVADIFVLPSFYETFSLVLLEAMSHKKPIVTTRILGTMALVKEKYNGTKFNTRDFSGLAEAVIKILSDQKLAKELGENGKILANEFSWEKTASRMVQVYESIGRSC